MAKERATKKIASNIPKNHEPVSVYEDFRLPNGKMIPTTRKEQQVLRVLIGRKEGEIVLFSSLAMDVYQRELNSGLTLDQVKDRLDALLGSLRSRTIGQGGLTYADRFPIRAGRVEDDAFVSKEYPVATPNIELSIVQPTVEVVSVPKAIQEAVVSDSVEKAKIELSMAGSIVSSPLMDLPKEIQVIEYKPSQKDIRTPAETNVLTVVAAAMTSYQHIRGEELVVAILSEEEKKKFIQGKINIRVRSVGQVQEAFLRGYAKIYNEKEVPGLRALWTEEDEKLMNDLEMLAARLIKEGKNPERAIKNEIEKAIKALYDLN